MVFQEEVLWLSGLGNTVSDRKRGKMESLVKEFLQQKNFAVVGSFRDETKYAVKILRDLKRRGHEVFPVNPKVNEVDGIKCYRTITEIPHEVDVVDIVTPPAVTEKIVEECFEKSIKRVWIQPGAESEKAINYCRENGIDVVYGLCIMMEKL